MISRGGIVDEVESARLAAAGHFRGVAFDVFETEPCPPDNPLRAIENAILTPHSIGRAKELTDRLPEAAIEKVRAILAGQRPESICNPHVLSRARMRGTTQR